MEVELHLLTAADFRAVASVLIHFSTGTVAAALIEKVVELSHYTELERKPFSVLFQTGQKQIYPQAIYPVEHPDLGKLEIFLVPVGCNAAGVQYEAVFS